jgi:hypothetical protein
MIFSVLISMIAFVHPLHISVTEINYSEKDKALQIMSRIFVDDLELSIQKDLKDEELNLLQPANSKTTNELVSAYLLKHFKIKADGKVQAWKYLGHEVESVAMICYLEIPNVKKLKSVEVMNDVIMETHADQSNLVHVTYKEVMKSTRLTREKPADVLNFETK